MVSQTNFNTFSQQTLIKRTLCCLLTMQIYFDSLLIFLHRINGFAHLWHIFWCKKNFLLIFFGTSTIIFDVLEEIVGKIIESWHISIFPIIDKIIDFEKRLPQIIGNLKELSVKLSISISKIYSYKKKWLIAHPQVEPPKKNILYVGLDKSS